jgi:hypothetical protein
MQIRTTPLAVQPLPPGPSFSQARRVKELFPLLSGVLNAHRYLLSRSPLFLSGNRASRYRETRGTVLVQIKTPNPDGSTSQLSLPFGDFPIGKSGCEMLRFTCTVNPRTPNSDDTCAFPSLRHLPFPLYRESRDRDFTGRNFFASKSPERRTPISPDFRHVFP